MAVLFISPTDTTGAYAPTATVEMLTERPRTIHRIKGTELETLWQLDPTVPTLPPMRIVTNRYEEAHRIMQEAYQRQEKQ